MTNLNFKTECMYSIKWDPTHSIVFRHHLCTPQ
jgi:hypothetical protein